MNTNQKAYLILKRLEKVREGANCDSNGFKKKDWLDIVRGLISRLIVTTESSNYSHSIPF